MSAAEAPFDGIVCIGGEDWWYHNRGHFDFQIMRRLAKRWPVLFVNSLGVRMPSLRHDRMFAQRIVRKLKSLSRGLVEAEPGFWVFSPMVAPGRAGQMLSAWALAPQIRLAARRAGIRRPLLWMHCPAGAGLVAQIPHVAMVMQRTDRFEAFPEADPAEVGSQIASLKEQADLVIYAAPHLEAEERGQVAKSLLVTHGVDLERFLDAGMARREPADMAGITGPRVGFIGGIDRHTFDPELFLDVVARLPDHQFVMVGACSLPDGWCSAPNVHFLGRKPYDVVADYMAAMDALIMPWNRSDWIKACNPIKLKEYLAVGRPVITTDFPALDGWRDTVRVADDAATFAMWIREATSLGVGASGLSERLAAQTWDAKSAEIAAALVDCCGSGDARTADVAGHATMRRQVA
ncbi:MAG: glycosyltransferase [Hyphomicrobiaceae bacterium]|nr:glycosyltransferase [Hyphomicrobiaceae bacterium]